MRTTAPVKQLCTTIFSSSANNSALPPLKSKNSSPHSSKVRYPNPSKPPTHNILPAYAAILLTLPPAELHDEKHQPGTKDGHKWGMPLDQFTDAAFEGLAAGKEEVTVGGSTDDYEAFEPQRQKIFHDRMEMIRRVTREGH